MLLFSVILTERELNPAEIILAWPNMWTNENLCVAHACRDDGFFLR